MYSLNTTENSYTCTVFVSRCLPPIAIEIFVIQHLLERGLEFIAVHSRYIDEICAVDTLLDPARWSIVSYEIIAIINFK